jgi:hypothetical protein
MTLADERVSLSALIDWASTTKSPVTLTSPLTDAVAADW